jgi:hypothetical protein
MRVETYRCLQALIVTICVLAIWPFCKMSVLAILPFCTKRGALPLHLRSPGRQARDHIGRMVPLERQPHAVILQVLRPVVPDVVALEVVLGAPVVAALNDQTDSAQSRYFTSR